MLFFWQVLSRLCLHLDLNSKGHFHTCNLIQFFRTNRKNIYIMPFSSGQFLQTCWTKWTNVQGLLWTTKLVWCQSILSVYFSIQASHGACFPDVFLKVSPKSWVSLIVWAFMTLNRKISANTSTCWLYNSCIFLVAQQLRHKSSLSFWAKSWWEKKNISQVVVFSPKSCQMVIHLEALGKKKNWRTPGLIDHQSLQWLRPL